ncbi:hypothetical protein P0L94_03585 [Microbacter sp. GSS18]|nr:hypothetical protein P0L94_03585 [Microbacter sp. GSS18]
MDTQSTTPSGRRGGTLLVLALATVVGFAAPAAAAAIGQAGGAASVSGSRWLQVDESESVTILQRPVYVDPQAPADRAERIIRTELERRRQVAADLRGMTADRLEREIGAPGE